MANTQDVNFAVAQIENIWANPQARNGRFGTALRAINVRGIRGLNVEVEFAWPVCAIGGVNGSGKTTLLQLCSAAYTKHGTVGRQFKLGRWVGQSIGAVDETSAVVDAARIIYHFYDAPSVDVRYQSDQTRWRYPRRGNPERDVDFVGIAKFAPRIEKTDRTHYNRGRLILRNTETIEPRAVESISRILGQTYTAAKIHTVSAPNAPWTDEIPLLSRNGVDYTEAHMGAGEQKVVRLVRHLERLPDKSLILLEEPELTLHPDAQFGLAWYLMTLAKRRGHQIIIATHSAHIFEAIPPAGRIILTRTGGATTVLQRVPKLSAARHLDPTAKPNNALVLVEDAVATQLLSHIFDRFSKELREICSIAEVGSSTDVRRLVSLFRAKNVRAIGVRDPDVGDDPTVGLFSLPGNLAPEQILLSQENVARAEQLFHGFIEAVQQAEAQGIGFVGSARAKRVMLALINIMNRPAEFIADRLASAWLNDQGNEAAARDLIRGMQDAIVADEVQ